MKLYGLTITNEYGTDLYLCFTEGATKAQLADYVRGEWEREVNERRGRDDECPSEDDAAIEAYFDIVEDETYSLKETELEGVIREAENTGRLSDAEALDRMAHLFSASEWPGSSGLEDLCGIVRKTGRRITDDSTIEWARH